MTVTVSPPDVSAWRRCLEGTGVVASAGVVLLGGAPSGLGDVPSRLGDVPSGLGGGTGVSAAGAEYCGESVVGSVPEENASEWDPGAPFGASRPDESSTLTVTVPSPLSCGGVSPRLCRRERVPGDVESADGSAESFAESGDAEADGSLEIAVALSAAVIGLATGACLDFSNAISLTRASWKIGRLRLMNLAQIGAQTVPPNARWPISSP